MSRLYAFVLVATLCVAGCDRVSGTQNLKLDSEYQAVFLTNGQVFYGKLEDAGKAFPKLSDVFYVQVQTNPETKQVTTTFIKRGREWHGPTYMYINGQHIVAIEPVAPDSKVMQAINEQKKHSAPAAEKK